MVKFQKILEEDTKNGKKGYRPHSPETACFNGALRRAELRIVPVSV
jgi:hypothetical protein